MTFWALVKYTKTGTVTRLTWPTPQARALEIIALAGYVHVIEEGHES